MAQKIEDVYKLQLLHYFMKSYDYQIVRTNSPRNDMWLVSQTREVYPIIRIYVDGFEDDLEYMNIMYESLSKVIEKETKMLLIKVQNEKTETKVIDSNYYTGYTLYPDKSVESELLEVFTGIDKVLEPVDNVLTGFRQMNAKMKTVIKEREKVARKKFTKGIPVTVGITLLSVIYFAVFVLSQFHTENLAASLVLCGGYYKANVVGLHEYYRLLTTGFLHLDIFQLFINLIVFLQLGALCEKIYKKRTYIFIFVLSIIIGNMFTLVGDGNGFTLGLNPGIMGLLGAYLVTMFMTGSHHIPPIRANMMRMVLFCAIIGLSPEISFMSLLGGFVTGLVMGFVTMEKPKLKSIQFHTRNAFAIFFAVLSLLCFNVTNVQPEMKESNQAIVKGIKKLGLEKYSEKLQQTYLDLYK